MSTGRRAREQELAYYSMLRWTPDPLLGETLNVGLLVFAEDGRWARFSRRAFRSRANQMATADQIEVAEAWINSFEIGAGVDSRTGDLNAPVTKSDVHRWAADSVSSLSFTTPSAAIGTSTDELWESLSDRYLGAARAAARTEVVAKPTGSFERRTVVRDFVAQCRDVPALREVVHRGETVRGRRLDHRLDVTIRNGQLAAVAHAIPFAYGSEAEIDERRALLVEAALDLPERVTKLGLFDAVPPDRQPLLDQTREFLDERLDGLVQLQSRDTFPDVVAELARTI